MRVRQWELPVDYEREEAQASEEWLIMVFPGGSKDAVTYVKAR